MLIGRFSHVFGSFNFGLKLSILQRLYSLRIVAIFASFQNRLIFLILAVLFQPFVLQRKNRMCFYEKKKEKEKTVTARENKELILEK